MPLRMRIAADRIAIDEFRTTSAALRAAAETVRASARETRARTAGSREAVEAGTAVLATLATQGSVGPALQAQHLR
jgi:hypothetical protein